MRNVNSITDIGGMGNESGQDNADQRQSKEEQEYNQPLYPQNIKVIKFLGREIIEEVPPPIPILTSVLNDPSKHTLVQTNTSTAQLFETTVESARLRFQ